LWYKYTAPQTTPNIPVFDPTMLVGQDPLFLDTLNHNFNLASGSPAIGQIVTTEEPRRDYFDQLFNNPRSIGAIEANPLTSLQDPWNVNELPNDFHLLSAYPNPFNPTTTLRIRLFSSNSNRQQVNLTIYNLLGERVKQVFNGSLSAGNYDFLWTGKNEQEELVASGIYLAVLVLSGEVIIEKLTYVR
jgi:hypothetical protein